MSDYQCPVCDSSEPGTETVDERIGYPFLCSSCRHPIVLNKYVFEDGPETRLEPAYCEEVDRVLPWVRSMVAVRRNLDKAVSLLYMLDRADARHPDVAAFLDSLEASRDGEVG